ncbi:MAG: sucrase ferredoxin, partial [Pseudonocardia sp.]|nr:sucrase ferredoxin [Pseudonocardia sp.]
MTVTLAAADGHVSAAPLPGCATLSSACGEAPGGTASPIRSWLMVEQPGAWDRRVRERVFADALPPARQVQLQHLWNTAGLRPLVIRRPGRQHEDGRRGGDGPRTVLVGGAEPGRRWLERWEIDDLRALADLDLDAVAAGTGGIGTPVSGPVFAVCTHGAKDMCCATAGRPVARALSDARPGEVWECSHIGGDRFAGN